MKTPNIIILSSLLALTWLGLLPAAKATRPRPTPSEDRGNGNSAAENVSALNLATTGSNNTAHGWFALFSNTGGSGNTADGYQALYSNTGDAFDGSRNTAVGHQALYGNTTGPDNTATGYTALYSNTGGATNTANGSNALFFNTIGFENTAIGAYALAANVDGTDNTAIGVSALAGNNGHDNIALGVSAGAVLTTGNNNIDIGSFGAPDDSDTIRIGRTHTRTFVAGIRGITTDNADAVPVLIDSAGQLGTISSSRRFKKEIKPMNKTSEAILALKPVTFHYRSDNTNTPQFGLIAEEVAKVSPDLVVRDINGEIYTVRYDAVNAMLLNEFLKEHQKVEKQQATVRQLESNAAEHEATISQFKEEMAILTAQLKEQAAQIQKVSARFKLNEPAPQMVLNDH